MNLLSSVTYVLLVLVTISYGFMPNKNHGSYVCNCDEASTEVVFINYAAQNCQGPSTNYSEPLNTCETEAVVASWNGLCNATNMWYQNFIVSYPIVFSIFPPLYNYSCRETEGIMYKCVKNIMWIMCKCVQISYEHNTYWHSLS